MGGGLSDDRFSFERIAAVKGFYAKSVGRSTIGNLGVVGGGDCFRGGPEMKTVNEKPVRRIGFI